MDRINEVTRDCLDGLIQLRRADAASLPAPEAVRSRMCGFVDEMMQRAAQAGFVQQDCLEIAYPVVALADEVAVGKSEAFRNAWLGQLLQLHYFRENTAGDGFFLRLQALRADPQRAEVLRVYYLCLLLGFQGRYRVRGGELELMGLVEALQQEVARTTRAPEALSPRSAQPKAAAAGPGLRALFLSAGAALAFSLLFYAGLRFSLSFQSAAVAEQLATAARR